MIWNRHGVASGSQNEQNAAVSDSPDGVFHIFKAFPVTVEVSRQKMRPENLPESRPESPQRSEAVRVKTQFSIR